MCRLSSYLPDPGFLDDLQPLSNLASSEIVPWYLLVPPGEKDDWERSFRLEKSQRYPILMCPRLEDLDQLDEKISWRSLSRAVLYDAVHQPPPVPPLGSVHRTGIGRGRRRRSSPGSRPLAPRSLPLRSTSRGRGADRGDGGPQTGSNEVLYFDHITR